MGSERFDTVIVSGGPRGGRDRSGPTRRWRRDGFTVLEDGRVLEVENVIWCTGFGYEFSWVDLPVFDANGDPVHERGVATADPGVTFVGLVFQYSFSSEALPNRGRDAAYIARHIASRTQAVRRTEPVLA